MNLRFFDLDFGELAAQIRAQDLADRVLGGEVAGVDEVDAQLRGLLELVVFDVAGDEGVAAGGDGLRQEIHARA